MSKETKIDRVWGNIRVKGNPNSERDKNRIGEKGFGLGGRDLEGRRKSSV